MASPPPRPRKNRSKPTIITNSITTGSDAVCRRLRFSTSSDDVPIDTPPRPQPQPGARVNATTVTSPDTPSTQDSGGTMQGTPGSTPSRTDTVIIVSEDSDNKQAKQAKQAPAAHAHEKEKEKEEAMKKALSQGNNAALWENPIGWDVLVCCRTHVWRVHRHILKAESPYLAARIPPMLPDVKHREISLHGHDPAQVATALYFMYSKHYDGASLDPKEPLKAGAILTNTAMFIAGASIDCRAMKAFAVRHIDEATAQLEAALPDNFQSPLNDYTVLQLEEPLRLALTALYEQPGQTAAANNSAGSTAAYNSPTKGRYHQGVYGGGPNDKNNKKKWYGNNGNNNSTIHKPGITTLTNLNAGPAPPSVYHPHTNRLFELRLALARLVDGSLMYLVLNRAFKVMYVNEWRALSYHVAADNYHFGRMGLLRQLDGPLQSYLANLNALQRERIEVHQWLRGQAEAECRLEALRRTRREVQEEMDRGRGQVRFEEDVQGKDDNKGKGGEDGKGGKEGQANNNGKQGEGDKSKKGNGGHHQKRRMTWDSPVLTDQEMSKVMGLDAVMGCERERETKDKTERERQWEERRRRDSMGPWQLRRG